MKISNVNILLLEKLNILLVDEMLINTHFIIIIIIIIIITIIIIIIIVSCLMSFLHIATNKLFLLILFF